MRERTRSALIAAPLALAVIVMGGTYLTLTLMAIGVMAARELYGLARRAGFRPADWAGALGVLALSVAGHLGLEAAGGVILGCVVLLSLTWQTVIAGGDNAIANSAITVFGAAYVGWGVASLLLLRRFGGLGAGLGHVTAAVLTVWATDIGAYFAGSAHGKHRLMPKVSPSKSIEGAAFGLVCGVAVGIASRWLGSLLAWWPALPFYHAVLFSALVSLAGQLGDLAESAMKRSAEVKDSGAFLPGHGGVLDRIDSLLFAIPVAYCYARLLLP